MTRIVCASVAFLPLLVLAGCEAAETPIETGPPVSPEALCGEVAEIVCDAAETCCEAGGAGDDCEEAQASRCMDSLGAMAADPRVGYVPERAGALLAHVSERAAGCFQEEPFALGELDVIFEGTIPSGGDCSPGAVDGAVTTAELHRAVVACEDGTTCRVRLAWDDAPLGTCEPRDDAGDDRCSHPYDCTEGTFCDLPDAWRIGDWGRCIALREDGWACASGVECTSGYCGDGVCGAAPSLNRCLVVDYPTLVLESAPILYQRLNDGEESAMATDDSGRSNHAIYVGAVMHTETGAIEDDGAIGLNGTDAYLEVESVRGMASDALTIELWVSVPEGAGGPLFVLEGSSSSLVIDVAGAALRARFIEPGASTKDPDTVFEVTSDPGTIGAGFHHVALVYDGEASRIFVDGVQAAELEGTQRLPASPALTIGARVGVDATTFFTGTIDEVAMYPSALEEEAFATRMRVATTGPIENEFVLFGWAR